MKKIIRLARLELALLFYSPVAWMTLIIFAIVGSITFIDKLTISENDQTLGWGLFMITNRLFNEFFGPGVIPALQSKLYFFIPLVTMGLMSREISSGSLKLLLSSPVKIREIILGKYLAVMLYGLVLMSAVLIFVLVTAFALNSPDYGLIISGMIGLYLMLCAYGAIGLFMSSLTGYQVVAALLTFTTFAVLDYVATLWQNYDLVRDITYNLALGNRMGQMSNGLMTSRDVFYFLSVICLFLGLTMIRLRNARQSTSITVSWMRYSLVVLAMISVGYITSRPKMIIYADMTHPKTNTISRSAQKVLQSLKEPLELTTYVNIFDEDAWDFMPANRQQDLAKLERYQRFHRDMKINYVYYYDSTATGNFRFNAYPDLNIDEIAEKDMENHRLPKSLFLTPAELKKRIRFRPEQDNRIARVLQLGNVRSIVQGTYDDMNKYPGDDEYMTALKIILEGRAHALFTIGHTEKDIFKRGDREAFGMTLYPRYKKNLVNYGVHSDTISLADREVPDSIMALFIIDPKLDFSPVEMQRLKRYIDKGGNLLIGVELRKREVVNKILAPLGIRVMDSSVLETSVHNAADYITADVMVLPGKTSDSLTRMGQMNMDGAGPLARTDLETGFKMVTIARPDTSVTWLRPGYVDVRDSVQASYHPESGDIKTLDPLAIHLSRRINNKEQRIVISGDADMYANKGASMWFVGAAVTWFTNGKYPMPYEPGIPFEDTKVLIGKPAIAIWKWVLWGVIPGIIAIAGAIILIRRKRK